MGWCVRGAKSLIGFDPLGQATFSIAPNGVGQILAIQGDWSSLNIGSDALGLPDALATARGSTRLDLIECRQDRYSGCVSDPEVDLGVLGTVADAERDGADFRACPSAP